MKKLTLLAVMAMGASAAFAQYTCDPVLSTVTEKGKVTNVGYLILDSESIAKLEAQGATCVNWGQNTADQSGNQNLWVWDGTFTGGDSSYPGVGDQVEGYASWVVGNVGWSGAGYNVTEPGISTEWFSDDTHFHMAYMTSGVAPASIAIIMGDQDGNNTPAKFAVGDPFNDNGVIFPAVGPKANDDWQGIDITFGDLKKIFPAFKYNADAAWCGNILSFLGGGVTGNTFAFDAMYFYQLGEAGGVDNVADEAQLVVNGRTVSALGANGIELFDLGGRLVKNTNGSVLGIDNLPAGVYVVRSGNSVCKVIVK